MLVRALRRRQPFAAKRHRTSLAGFGLRPSVRTRAAPSRRPVRNQSSMNRSGAAAGPVSIHSMPKGLPVRLDHARLEDGPSLLVGRPCAGSNDRQGRPNAKVGSSACRLLARTVSSERFGGACSLAREIRQRRAGLRLDWIGMAALPVRHPARFHHLAYSIQPRFRAAGLQLGAWPGLPATKRRITTGRWARECDEWAVPA